jgi:hypothetical protein
MLRIPEVSDRLFNLSNKFPAKVMQVNAPQHHGFRRAKVFLVTFS